MPRAPPVERLPVREALRESRHAGDSPQRARQRPGSAPVGAPPVTRRGIWRGIPPFHERQNPRLRCGFRCRSCSPARNSTGNPRPRTSTTAATGCPLRGGRGQSGPGCSGAGGFGGAVRRGPEAGWAALDGPASPAWAGVSRRRAEQAAHGPPAAIPELSRPGDLIQVPADPLQSARAPSVVATSARPGRALVRQQAVARSERLCA